MAEKPPKANEEPSYTITSNITLRPLQLSDIDDVMVWVTDDRVSRFCIWDTHSSRDQTLNFFKNNALIHPWFRVICINDRSVGSISVNPKSGNDICRAELGYVLAHEHWGKGIVTEAVKIVVSTIFDEWLHLERLEAFVDIENKGSQRVLEKSGFVKEGVLRKHMIFKGKVRDTVVFSLLSSDRKVYQ